MKTGMGSGWANTPVVRVARCAVEGCECEAERASQYCARCGEEIAALQAMALDDAGRQERREILRALRRRERAELAARVGSVAAKACSGAEVLAVLGLMGYVVASLAVWMLTWLGWWR